MDWTESEFLNEEELEALLMDMGVTKEQLKRDLEESLTLEPHPCSMKSCVLQKNGREYTVCAEGVQAPTGAIRITEWLDTIPIEELMGFWEDREERNKIKALMRYPGGQHEWLMLAAIPMLKVMEIPMEAILRYRTPTDECFFYANGGKCWHGGEGSTAMHNDLFKAIGAAYMDLVRRRVHHRNNVLRERLQEFARRYYCYPCGGFKDMPEALKALTGM